MKFELPTVVFTQNKLFYFFFKQFLIFYVRIFKVVSKYNKKYEMRYSIF